MPAVERLESLQLLSGYTYDFSGYKFEDKNQNGKFDYDSYGDKKEYGLEGWTIRAYADENYNGQLDQQEYDDGPVDWDKTDKYGKYDLNLEKGSYIIVEVQKYGWDQTAPYNKVLAKNLYTDNETLGPYGFAAYVKKDSYYNNFGNHKQEREKVGYESGTKFNDLNANGERDAGEPGLAGWHIRAFYDLNGNGLIDYNVEATKGNVAAEAVTDANGNYTLKLKPGDYVTVETTSDHPDWYQSYPTNDVLAPKVSNVGHGGYAFTIYAGEYRKGDDFGNYKNATISGEKFNDKNHNGYQDSYEDGLEGWEIRAYVDANHNHKLDKSEYKAGFAKKTYTDYDGNYTLSLKPGDYIIVEVLQKNWKQSYPDDVVLYDHFDHLGKYGYSETVTSGQKVYGDDFGNFYKKRDYHDKDQDGYDSNDYYW